MDRKGLVDSFHVAHGVLGIVRDVKRTVDFVRGKDRPRPMPRPYPWGLYAAWHMEMMLRFNRYLDLHPWHTRSRQVYRPSPIFTHGHGHYR